MLLPDWKIELPVAEVDRAETDNGNRPELAWAKQARIEAALELIAHEMRIPLSTIIGSTRHDVTAPLKKLGADHRTQLAMLDIYGGRLS